MELDLYSRLAKRLPSPLDIETFNRLDRVALKDVLDNYFHCEDTMHMMTSLLQCLMNQSQQKYNRTQFLRLSSSIRKLLTNLKILSNSTTQGITMTSGIQYLDKLILLKYAIAWNADIVLLHEIVAGLLLNNLRSMTPCFMYVYGGFTCEKMKSLNLEKFCDGNGKKSLYMLAEYIPGKTLLESTYQLDFTFDDYVKILYMIAWSLNLAKERYQFGHYDLHAENIIIRKFKYPRIVTLRNGSEEVKISTCYIPVIIDYGYSQFTYENKIYYGERDIRGDMIESQDIVKVLFHSMMSRRYNKQIHQLIVKSGLYSRLNSKDKERAGIISKNEYDFNYFYPTYPFPKFTWKNLLAYFDNEYSSIKTIEPYQSEMKCPSIIDTVFPLRNCELDSLLTVKKDGTTMPLPSCAASSFDGSFNVINLTKGIELYHCGNANERLYEYGGGDEKINNYTSTIIQVSQYPVAYDDDEKEGCIMAYKVSKQCSFIHLGDVSNLKLLFGSDSPLSDDEKEMLAIVYGYNPRNRALPQWNDNVRTPRYKCHKILMKRLVKIAEDKGYAGIVIIDKEVGSEFWLGDKIQKYMKRDYNNIHDWQYIDLQSISESISSLIEDMSNYKTTSGQHHSGNVLEHSMWTALFMQQLIRNFDKNSETSSKWISGINITNFRALLAACFLHDIGKSGDNVLVFDDKINHPDVGAGYILGTEKYKLVGNVGILNFETVLKNMGVYEFRNVIAIMIGCHQYFGSVVKGDISIDEFIKIMRVKVTKFMKKKVNNRDFQQIVLMTMALTATDVMAAQMFPENRYIEDFPFISNRGRRRKGGNEDIYDKYGYGTKGLKLRQLVIERL